MALFLCSAAVFCAVIMQLSRPPEAEYGYECECEYGYEWDTKFNLEKKLC